MKLASTLCLAAASVCALAAIWSPWHWQSAATAVLLVLIGAGLVGQKKPDDIEVHLHDFHGYHPEDLAVEIARQHARSDALRPQDGEQGAGRPETSPDASKPGEANLPRGKNDYGRSAK